MDQNTQQNYDNPQVEKVILIERKNESSSQDKPQETEVYKKGKEVYKNNKNAVIGTIIGVLIAILFLSIGFFETLLILLLGFIGYVVGSYKDGNSKVISSFNNLIRR